MVMWCSSRVTASLTEEMERRYDLLQDENCQTIRAYTYISGRKIPDIFVFIDELSDNSYRHPHALELLESMFTMAKPTSIHVLVATSRPEEKTLGNLPISA